MKEPTRKTRSGKAYLLDLVLTDAQHTKATVTRFIADHKGILIKLPCPEIQCEVWNMSRADWNDLRQSLADLDWKLLREDSAEDAVDMFIEAL